MVCSDHSVSLYLYLKIKPFVHQDEEKNVPFFLFYTISGENIKVKKNVLTNIQVESTSLDFLACFVCFTWKFL